MCSRIQDLKELEKELMKILGSSGIIENAYGQGLSQRELLELAMPLLEAVLSFNKERVIKKSPQQKWKVMSVKDIEDCFWNPEFGIKGKVDCTVEIKNELHEDQVSANY